MTEEILPIHSSPGTRAKFYQWCPESSHFINQLRHCPREKRRERDCYSILWGVRCSWGKMQPLRWETKRKYWMFLAKKKNTVLNKKAKLKGHWGKRLGQSCQNGEKVCEHLWEARRSWPTSRRPHSPPNETASQPASVILTSNQKCKGKGLPFFFIKWVIFKLINLLLSRMKTSADRVAIQ